MSKYPETLEEGIRFILVVDDDPVERQLYSAWIKEGLGELYVTVAVENLEIAKTVLNQCYPDCILLDYRLTNGNGLEYLEYLKGHYGEMPANVIFITGYKNEIMEQTALDAGATHFMYKQDLNADTLAKLVKKIVTRNMTG